MMSFTPRRSPPHTRPSWVEEDEPIFLTFACATRGINQLANHEAWAALMSASDILTGLGKWQPLVLLAMPDHVHALARVPRHHRMGKIIGTLKRSVTGAVGIKWQRNFFDHRPRTKSARWACKEYILMNPVRKGLCRAPEEWPYKWIYGNG